MRTFKLAIVWKASLLDPNHIDVEVSKCLLWNLHPAKNLTGSMARPLEFY